MCKFLEKTSESEVKVCEIQVGGLEGCGREVYQKKFCTLLLTLHKFTTGAETSGFLLR